jgi:hypothetical protein
VARAIEEAANSAFFSGFHAGDLVAAGVAAVGAVVALALLPAQPTAGAAEGKGSPGGAAEDGEPTPEPAGAAG